MRKTPGKKLNEALAVLITSTHSRKRPLSLVEISEWLQFAIDQLNDINNVATRLGISDKMLRQFLAVNRLTTETQDLFKSRALDSVDAAVHLSFLPERDQIIAAKALASKEINTIDLRAVINLRHSGDGNGIDQQIKKVIESKTRREYIVDFVIRGDILKNDIYKLFSKYIPHDEILSLSVDGPVGRIILSQKGKRAIMQAAKELGVPLNKVVSKILYTQGD
jgi:hypothetical protein